MSVFFPLIEINGTIETSNSCLANLNEIATNTQSFLSWDPELGAYTARINRPVDNIANESVMDFDDDNIVGSITVSGSGITDKYNQVRISYNSIDLEGEKDEIVRSVTNDARYSNEVDNELSISYGLVAYAWQADRLGLIELQQSRVDKIISFATDFRAINLKPGQIIRVSNEQYGYINKAWRIESVDEIETEEGGLLVGINALEFDNSVYSSTGISAPERNRNTGIVPAETNLCVIEKTDKATTAQVGRGLQQPEGREIITSVGVPIFETISTTWSTSQVLGVYGPGTGVNGANGIEQQIIPYFLGNGVYSNDIRTQTSNISATWSTLNTIKTMEVDFTGPQGNVNYTINGKSGTYNAGIPTLTYLFYSNSPNGPWILAQRRYMEWSSYITKFTQSNVNLAPVYWLFMAGNLVTYDLSETANIVVNIDQVNQIFPANDGSGADITVKLFLN